MEGNGMKEYDLVELLVEKTGYAKYGVHKGMQGCVFDSRSMDAVSYTHLSMIRIINARSG